VLQQTAAAKVQTLWRFRRAKGTTHGGGEQQAIPPRKLALHTDEPVEARVLSVESEDEIMDRSSASAKDIARLLRTSIENVERLLKPGGSGQSIDELFEDAKLQVKYARQEEEDEANAAEVRGEQTSERARAMDTADTSQAKSEEADLSTPNEREPEEAHTEHKA
jgi:hypothetical protein